MPFQLQGTVALGSLGVLVPRELGSTAVPQVPVEEEAHNRVDAGPEQTSATRRLSGRPGDLCQAIPRPRGHWPQHRAPRAAGRAV